MVVEVADSSGEVVAAEHGCCSVGSASRIIGTDVLASVDGSCVVSTDSLLSNVGSVVVRGIVALSSSGTLWETSNRSVAGAASWALDLGRSRSGQEACQSERLGGR